MPIIIKIPPIILFKLSLSFKKKTEHKIVTIGEHAIISITIDADPFLSAAKYARSPINVAKVASATIKNKVFVEILLSSAMLPFRHIQIVITIAVKIVLTARPVRGFIFLNPSLANIGETPQQIIPNIARK